MVEGINNFKETSDIEKSLKLIYYKGKENVSMRTKRAFEEGLDFINEVDEGKLLEIDSR